MNRILRETMLVVFFFCQALSALGQLPDSTFTSYDWIKPSVVSAKQSILREQGDTSIFNPSSVMLHDGATIDALFLEIPGLSIDVKGNVSVSGRPVRELLVEGRRYFGTDHAIFISICYLCADDRAAPIFFRYRADVPATPLLAHPSRGNRT